MVDKKMNKNNSLAKKKDADDIITSIMIKPCFYCSKAFDATEDNYFSKIEEMEIVDSITQHVVAKERLRVFGHLSCFVDRQNRKALEETTQEKYDELDRNTVTPSSNSVEAPAKRI